MFRVSCVVFPSYGAPLLGPRAVSFVVRETDEGLLDRDYYVITTCLEMGVPVACVVGGGYDSDRRVLATRHSTVFKAAFQAWGDFDERAKWRERARAEVEDEVETEIDFDVDVDGDY